MKFDDKEDMQMPAHDLRSRARSRSNWTIQNISHGPFQTRRASIVRAANSLIITSQLWPNSSHARPSQKSKRKVPRKLPSIRIVNEAVGYLGVLNTIGNQPTTDINYDGHFARTWRILIAWSLDRKGLQARTISSCDSSSLSKHCEPASLTFNWSSTAFRRRSLSPHRPVKSRASISPPSNISARHSRS